VQATAGKAAFAYIRKSIDIALAHDADAVVTAPINKEALKLAQIPLIGHRFHNARSASAKRPRILRVEGLLSTQGLNRSRGRGGKRAARSRR